MVPEGLDDVDITAGGAVDRVVLRVGCEQDILAAEGAGEPVGELSRGDAAGAQGRGPGNLLARGELDLCAQEGVAGFDLLLEQFEQAQAAELVLQQPQGSSRGEKLEGFDGAVVVFTVKTDPTVRCLRRRSHVLIAPRGGGCCGPYVGSSWERCQRVWTGSCR